jgi:hypothetical protein
MFSQSPFVGPGTGGFMTHTLEILVMLGVALLLGALLYFIATREQRRRLRSLTAEVAKLRTHEATLTQRLETAEENLARARDDLAATARVLAHQHDVQSHEPVHHQPSDQEVVREPVHHDPMRHEPDQPRTHPPATTAAAPGPERAPGIAINRDEPPHGVRPIPAAT